MRIVTPSRCAALSKSGENGETIEKEEADDKKEDIENEKVKREEVEKDEDEINSQQEKEEEKIKEVEVGGEAARQSLPRQSKTLHKIILGTSTQNRERNPGNKKRGSRKNL